MRYVSLFSGIEAASLAWEPLGWEAVAFAEIEPFPCKVLEKRFPGVPNLGDVSKVDWSPYAGAVDVVVGGSPCQAFSVAGKRKGLMDERGRLMLEYVRAVRDLGPRWLVWENVPGVLSQDGGRAFGTLLGALDDIGYSLAWRVLDAQFFGVAQRRRRVFLVGHIGAGGGAPAAVLFEPDSVSGNTKSSKQKREELAAVPQGGAGGGGGCLTPWGSQTNRVFSEKGPFQTLQAGDRSGTNRQAVCLKYHQGAKAGGIGAQIGQSPTLTADYHQPAVVYDTTQVKSPENGSNPRPGDPCHHLAAGMHAPLLCATQYGEDLAGTLTARGDGSPCADRGPNVLCVADDNANAAIDDDVSGTLKCGGGSPWIASRATGPTCAAPSAPGITRESETRTSEKGR